jgi:two-component system, NtrC family, response regulator AtoC
MSVFQTGGAFRSLPFPDCCIGSGKVARGAPRKTPARGSHRGDPVLVQSPDAEPNPGSWFAHSDTMRALWEAIVYVAETNATVLVSGESGVGKELAAKAIHGASPRRERRFVKVNCAALPGELLESELFGHDKGAFTGAYRRKLGKFELAHGGTIFLDEIGDMPVGLQAKLLHVLQDHEIVRIGGTETIEVDARVIAATNRDLAAAVRTGQFREDLYYRLRVVHLRVPPLRERREEIQLLAVSFLERFNREFRREMALSQESLGLLAEYDWPGNVRELENMIKRVVVLRREDLLREEIQGHLAARVVPPLPAAPSAAPPTPSQQIRTLKEIARRAAIEAQREALLEILERVRWNRAEAARQLRMSYRALLYKMEQCGLGPRRSTSDPPDVKSA